MFARTLKAAQDPGAGAYLQRIAYDPGPHLTALQVPALYVLATEVTVVPARQSAEWLPAHQRAGADVEIQLVPEVGHTFYHWTGA